MSREQFLLRSVPPYCTKIRESKRRPKQGKRSVSRARLLLARVARASGWLSHSALLVSCCLRALPPVHHACRRHRAHPDRPPTERSLCLQHSDLCNHYHDIPDTATPPRSRTAYARQASTTCLRPTDRCQRREPAATSIYTPSPTTSPPGVHRRARETSNLDHGRKPARHDHWLCDPGPRRLTRAGRCNAMTAALQSSSPCRSHASTNRGRTREQMACRGRNRSARPPLRP